MIDLEIKVGPKFSIHMTKWKKYTADTIAYINPKSVNCVLIEQYQHKYLIYF